MFTRPLGVAAAMCLVALCAGCASGAADDLTIASPDDRVRFQLLLDQPRARLAVSMGANPVVEPSPIVFTLDGVDLTQGAQQAGAVEKFTTDETYPYRGVHSKAVDRCNGARIPLKHTASNTAYTLEVRVYNDGVAYRTAVPGKPDQKRVPDERTSFVIPDGSVVWHHSMRGHYEGTYEKSAASQIAAGQWVAPPMTYKLPGSAGYAAITEANLSGYSGMALEATGQRGFTMGLGHRQPVSYPYELRYSKEDIERLSKPAVLSGVIRTPWRVVLVAKDLNTLVNSDIIPNCCPPADPKLFPNGINTDWVKPGRAVWRYTDGGENTIDEIRNFSRLAGKLGFEHQVVEGLWRRWSPDDLRDVVNLSKQNNVGLIVWEHSRNLRTPEEQEAFFKKLHDFGIAGAKIDFFDHEHKETVDQYQALLRKAAEYKIVLNFHGANKPTGEPRTWPNELTREAIRGMEASRFTARALHETIVPFTRYLAGHAEYTVVHFGARRGDSSNAHQLATAVIMYAPLLTWSLHPQKALDSPAVEMIKSIPAVWDETIVLEPSEIGELAIFARRSGDAWFLAIANGPEARSVKVPLSFLGSGSYQALIVRDGKDAAPPTTQPMGVTAMVVEHASHTRGDTLTLDLAAGGGLVARFGK